VEKILIDPLQRFVVDRFSEATVRVVGFKYDNEKDYVLLVTDQKYASGKNIGIFINKPNMDGDRVLRDLISVLKNGESAVIRIWLTKRANNNHITWRDYPYTFSVSSEESGLRILDIIPEYKPYPVPKNYSGDSGITQTKIDDFSQRKR